MINWKTFSMVVGILLGVPMTIAAIATCLTLVDQHFGWRAVLAIIMCAFVIVVALYTAYEKRAAAHLKTGTEER